MSARTVNQDILERHRSSALLWAPFLSAVPRDARDLSVDQPAAPLDSRVREEAVKALRDGQTHYVDVPGIGPLREAIVVELGRLGVAGHTVDTAVVTAGIQESRFLSIQTIAGAGGTIAVPAVVHPGAQKAMGLRPLDVRTLPVDAASGMVPTSAGLREAFDEGVRLLYLESPVRLTGAVLGATLVDEIAALLETYDAHAIVDQGLAPWLNGDGFVALAARPGMRERVTVIGELFPGRGLEGWGIGYLATNADHVGDVTKLKQVMSICTSTPSQFASLAASRDGDERRAALLGQLREARSAAVEAANAAGFEVLEGAAQNVLALRHADLAAMKTALDAAGVRYADGAAYGADDVLRVAVAATGATTEALQNLR